MNITATSKLKTHKNTQKTRTLFVILLTVVLIFSLLIIGVFMINSNGPSPDGTVHVKNEKQLTNTINKAKKSTTITLDNDITLTKPIIIPNKKEITLTNNTTTTDNFF
jgi:cell division septal protein FtsQ